MSWQKTLRKDPRIVVKAKPHWENTIRPEPKVIHGNDGKDFNFTEHEFSIKKMIMAYIDSIKEQLKLKFSDLSAKEKAELKGDNGKDANKWHLYAGKETQGDEGDFAISEKGNVYVMQSGEWSFKFQLKGQENKVMGVGGISEQFVIDYVAAHGSSGGGSTIWTIESTTTNITLDAQDVIIAKGSSPLTISLKNAATATKPVVVKNKTTQTLTINVSGGALIDDDTSWEISPNTAFEFVPQGGQYYAY